MWNTFLTSNSSSMRLLRTIVQGVIGVVIANLDAIIGSFTFSATTKALIVGITMAILSPIMGEIGKHLTDAEEVLLEADDTRGAFISDDEESLQ